MDAQVARIQRLWTPLNTPPEGDAAAEKRFETARQKLGALSQRQLDLRDDSSALDDQQWEWLLRERLSAGHNSHNSHNSYNSYSLSRFMRIFQKYQPIIAALDQRITRADTLINHIVYRLYRLTSEEIAVVEGV